jgi:hypothetical protein
MRGEVSRARGESAGGDKINLPRKENNKPAGEYKNRRNERTTKRDIEPNERN